MMRIPGCARLGRAPAVALGCLALFACTPIAGWRDTSGRDRDRAQASADVEICNAETGEDKLENTPYPEDLAGQKARTILWGRVETCMAKRDWVPDIRKWWSDTT